MLIPRLIPYAVFFTVSTILYVILSGRSLNIIVVFFGLLAAMLFWVEGLRFAILLRKIRKMKK